MKAKFEHLFARINEYRNLIKQSFAKKRVKSSKRFTAPCVRKF